MEGNIFKKALQTAAFINVAVMIVVPTVRYWYYFVLLYPSIVAVILYIHQRQTMRSYKGFPGPPAIPILGHVHLYATSRAEKQTYICVKIAVLLVLATLIIVKSAREWWCVLVLSIAYLVIVLAWFQHQNFRKLNGFRCPDYVPLLGHSEFLMGSRLNMFQASRDMRAKCGSRFLVFVLNEFSVNISDADSVEVILSCTKNLTKNSIYGLLRPWLGDGLLTSTGQHWATYRKLLTPAFHFSILDKLAVRLQFHSEKFADSLEELFQSDPNGSVDLMPHISKTTLSAILEVAMGVDFREAGDDYFKAIHGMGESIFMRMARPWLWNDFIYSFLPDGKREAKLLKLLHGFSTKVIAQRKSLYNSKRQESNLTDDDEENKIGIRKKLAFLDVLLTAQMNGAQISDEDIRNQVDTFMFEGHDTIAVSVYWTLYLLADHPEIQERLREEVQSVDLKEAPKLPYLDRVIRESLRLYPSVPFFARNTEHPIKFGENQEVFPPIAVHIHVFDLHRDPEQFPDPLKFDPDREYPTHPFAYVPFSGGSRNCIGRRLALLELKLIVAATLRRIRLCKPPIPHLEVPIPLDLVLRPGAKIKIPLEKL